MAQQQQQKQALSDIIQRLGSLQDQGRAIASLAEAVKVEQNKLNLAVNSAVKVINALNSANIDLSDLIQRAQTLDQGQRETVQQIKTRLESAPAQQTINDTIQQLRNVVSTQGQDGQFVLKPQLNAANLTADEKSAIGVVGGFNWRSQSNRPKKSTRITRRRSKSKIKSRRTTRNKGKKSIRKSKSKSN